MSKKTCMQDEIAQDTGFGVASWPKEEVAADTGFGVASWPKEEAGVS